MIFGGLHKNMNCAFPLGSTYLSCSIGSPDVTLKLNVREVVQLTSKMLLVKDKVRTKRFGGL